MAEYRKVPVAALVDPANQMRSITTMDGMDELMESLNSEGLINPITVREVTSGVYQVVAGHRRSIAVTKLGWDEVDCRVLGPMESDTDAVMAAENLMRTQVNEMEEAEMYARLVEGKKMDPRGIAAAYHVPESRVRNLLAVLAGDARCQALVAEGKMSVAQALEVSQFESEAYRTIAINYAVEGGMSATRLALWRKDIQSKGLEIGVDDAVAQGETPTMIDVSVPMTLCTLLNHPVNLVGTRQYTVCPDCWNTYVQALEALQREATLHDAGLWLPYLDWRKQNLGG